MFEFQILPLGSTQFPAPFFLTTSPTLGAAGNEGDLGGTGGGSESPASAAESTVACALELNTSTRMFVPSRLAASARGMRPAIGITIGAAARLVGSYALTASSCETLTYALPAANATSFGSSPPRSRARAWM